MILLGGPISFLFAQDIVPPGFHFQFDLGDLPELKTDSPGEETLSPSPADLNKTRRRLLEKKIVTVPELERKPFLNAGDFRDPFFLLRNPENNSSKVLQPGTTLDGIRFNSYSDSNKFIEKFYRESQFSIQDIFESVVHMEWRGGCMYCHLGIEQISDNHKFSCTRCHRGKSRGRTIATAHKGLVSNPSDLKHAKKFCGKCHQEHIQNVERSKMATARGIINTTRYAWGAQSYEEVPFSLNPDEHEQAFGAGKEKLPVDSFLRKKCLRCHLQSPSPHRPGDYRATGCAACHMVYANDGLTLTYDRAIQSVQQEERRKQENRFSRKFANRSMKNRRGYPILHKFTTAIPSVQCEHCHNQNGVGSEFEGLFAKPARPKSSRQVVDADQPVLYGTEHEFLLPDIHRERGMHCIDCHGSNEIKGPITQPEHSAVEIRCEDCHGTHENPPEGFLLVESHPNTKIILKPITRNPVLKKKITPGDTILVTSKGTPIPHIRQEKDQWFLFSKVTGKKHPIPVLKNMEVPLAHKVDKHMETMECHACHARWSASEWGAHVIQDDSPDLSLWKDWGFSDPTLQHLLTGAQEETVSDKMLDWLSARSEPGGISGDWTPGTWWNIFTETGWDTMILGKNKRGKYSILKPRYQYFLTKRRGEGIPPGKRAAPPMTKDQRPGFIMQAHTPHTIRKTVRSCESCHENALTAGLGDPIKQKVDDAERFQNELEEQNRVLPQFQVKQMITETGDPIQNTFPKEIRFLAPEEIAALEEKTDLYRALRYMDLRALKFPRLLAREEFIYDIKHRKNEEKYGLQDEGDLIYDMDANKFTATGPPHELAPSPEVKTDSPEDGSEKESIPGSPDTTVDVTPEGDKIIEFFRSLFLLPAPPAEPESPNTNIE
ncbi:MAG: hypothetical protein VX667_01450 [Nitrospinota bacterium]|nr:hypothetical protein [Nitrospinota bacterium]